MWLYNSTLPKGFVLPQLVCQRSLVGVDDDIIVFRGSWLFSWTLGLAPWNLTRWPEKMGERSD